MLLRIQVLICQNLGLKEKVLRKVERHLQVADARCQSLRLICQLGRYKQRKELDPEQIRGVPPEFKEAGRENDWPLRTSVSGWINRM
jgi:hypothetical protein